MEDANNDGQATLTSFGMCSSETQRVLRNNHLRPQDCVPCMQSTDVCLKCGIAPRTLG